ncbi:hypothetical protein RRF57_001851 [Xylaria bambusicola]|uniref:Uncharacterized protein n=1 Tax=Xylaria bambusicola TaxID=326684 RepID=A0AAN7Z6H5_9PEZI
MDRYHWYCLWWWWRCGSGSGGGRSGGRGVGVRPRKRERGPPEVDAGSRVCYPRRRGGVDGQVRRRDPEFFRPAAEAGDHGAFHA